MYLTFLVILVLCLYSLWRVVKSEQNLITDEGTKISNPIFNKSYITINMKYFKISFIIDQLMLYLYTLY